MDEYNLCLIIMGGLSLAMAFAWHVGALVERDKWRRRQQISWELRNKARQDRF